MNAVIKGSVVVSMLAATALLLASAQASASGTAVWGGTTGTFNEGCAFQQNVAGQMKLAGNTWKVVNPALIRIKTRNVGNIKIVSDNKLRTAADVAVDSATVNYTGTTVTGGHQGGVVNINPTEVTIGNLQNGNGVKVVHIQLRGTAEMSNTDELSSTTAYKINHTITCMQ
jgi:hypothetical protein